MSPLSDVVSAIFRDLDAHMDGGPMTDDQTLVVARVK